MLGNAASELCWLEVGKEGLLSYLLAVCSPALSYKNASVDALVIVCLESFLIHLLFQSVKCLIWKTIFLPSFVFFLERWRSGSHWWPHVPIRWKTSSWLSAARHTAGVPYLLFCTLCQFEDRRPCCRLHWDFLSLYAYKGSLCSIWMSPEKPPPSRLRIKTSPCRAVASLGCVAVIMQRFH